MRNVITIYHSLLELDGSMELTGPYHIGGLKMMKKSWKNRSAVSPVIATILMVAITVVLAAVLYVMVMGMGGSGLQAPKGSLDAEASGEIITVSIEPAISFTNMRYSVGGSTPAAIQISMDSTTGWVSTAIGSSIIIIFEDIGGDGKVTSGDHFIVSGKKGTSETITLNLLWTNGDTVQNVHSLTI